MLFGWVMLSPTRAQLCQKVRCLDVVVESKENTEVDVQGFRNVNESPGFFSHSQLTLVLRLLYFSTSVTICDVIIIYLQACVASQQKCAVR